MLVGGAERAWDAQGLQPRAGGPAATHPQTRLGTTTRLRGATYLRAGIVNYLSTEDDVDRLLEVLDRLGEALPTDA